MIQNYISRFISKQKNKKKEELNYDSKHSSYTFPYKNYTIYSHNKACIMRTKRQILENEIYKFQSESTPIIIDAGANIGVGILYWKSLFPEAKITAFKPSREVFKSFKKNVELNDLSDVTLVNKAVSDAEGTVKFTTNEIISGSLVLDKNLPNTYTVETVRLSPFLNEEIDFLKNDIEGAEKQVFPEISGKLKNIKYLFLEYHAFENEKEYLSQILQTLEDQNFSYYIEDDFKVNHPFTANYTSLGHHET